jgi:tetratricopeptide (TPR) repeat protein
LLSSTLSISANDSSVTDDGNLTTSPMSIFKDDGHWNHFGFEDAVVKMQELSLLQFSRCNESEITVSLHSMVSEWLRMRLDKGPQLRFLNTAISHLECHLDSIGDSDYKTRQEGEAHLDTIWRGMESFNIGDDLLGARVSFGNFYRDQGRLKDAEMMYKGALAGYEKAWGPEHTSTLDTVNNLGILYADQGRLEDAETMYNRALAGYEKACGPEHTSTLDTVNNLGILYADQGRLEDAEMMYKRALAGYEKAWGPEHTSTLDTVNNLGVLYKNQGRLEDAEMMYKRALAGKEKAWGPEHTSTLDTVNNLGLLYANQGRLEDAEMMYKRALLVMRRHGDQSTRPRSTPSTTWVSSMLIKAVSKMRR